MYPARGQGAVVMVNSIQGWFLRGELIEAIGREYRWPPARSIPVAVPMPAGVSYAGLYRGDDGATVKVTLETERLLIHFEQQEPLPVFQTAGDEFFAKAIDLRVRFGGSDAARPASLTIVQADKTFSFKRMDRLVP